MQNQVGGFLERRMVRKVVDVVATVREPGALFADRAEMRFAGRYAGQPAGFPCFAHVILSFPSGRFSFCPS